MKIMDRQFVQEFARRWVEAWNTHDLDQVLAHYDDDFEMTSPMITRITGEPSGRLKGKKAIGEYWARGLEKYPDLHFDLLYALSGTDRVAVVYDGVAGVTLELFRFDAAGKVTSTSACYSG